MVYMGKPAQNNSDSNNPYITKFKSAIIKEQNEGHYDLEYSIHWAEERKQKQALVAADFVCNQIADFEGVGYTYSYGDTPDGHGRYELIFNFDWLSSKEEKKRGILDFDGDGRVDYKDLRAMMDVNNDGKVDLKDFLRMLSEAIAIDTPLGDRDGSIVPNWKETLVIIIAVSIFGEIAFSFLT